MIVIKLRNFQRSILGKQDLRFFAKCRVSSKVGRSTLYSILEVDSKADQKDIKEAFLKLSKKWHPDMHISSEKVSQKQAEDNFRKIMAAYEVLSDPDKRLSYDKEIGIGKSQGFPDGPQRVHQWRPGKETVGVDPVWGRQVEVDMSEERMKKSWEAYKKRWELEEDKRKDLEERKLHFRIYMDKRREMFDHLTEVEKNNLKESMRMFRNPRFTKESLWTEFLDKTNAEDSYRKQDFLSRKNRKEQPAEENPTNSSSTFSDRLSESELKQRVKEESEKLQKSFEGSKAKKEDPGKSFDFEAMRAKSETFWRFRNAADKDEDKDKEENDIEENLLGGFKKGAFDYERSPEDPLSFGNKNSNIYRDMREAFQAKSSRERIEKAESSSEDRGSSQKSKPLPKFRTPEDLKNFMSDVKQEVKDYELLSDAKFGGRNSGMRSEYKISAIGFGIAAIIFFISSAIHIFMWQDIHDLDTVTAVNYSTQKANTSK